MKRYVRFAVMILFLVVGIAHASDALQVMLSQPSNSVDKQTGVVVLTLTNHGTTPIDVLKWKSPFVEAGGGLASDLFTITDSTGKRAAYTGSFAKFVHMTADSFIHLQPGQSVSKIVDLGRDYNLSDGVYTVTYDQDMSAVPPKDGAADAEQSALHIGAHSASNALQIWINSSLLQAKKKIAAEQSGFTRPNDPSSCGSNQQALSSALAVAQSMANTGLTYEENQWQSNGSWVPTSLFTYWLGNDGPITSAQATDLFDNADVTSHNMEVLEMYFMTQKLQSTSLNLECDPCTGWNSSTVAHSTTSTPYLIYICPAYFNLATSGADSQGGTILHELSHFSYSEQNSWVNSNGVTEYNTLTVNGTSDYAYGTTASAALATSNVPEARYNADSWEFFYENPTGLQ